MLKCKRAIVTGQFLSNTMKTSLQFDCVDTDEGSKCQVRPKRASAKGEGDEGDERTSEKETFLD